MSKSLQKSWRSSGNFSLTVLPSFFTNKAAGKPQLYLMLAALSCSNIGFSWRLRAKVPADKSENICRAEFSNFTGSSPCCSCNDFLALLVYIKYHGDPFAFSSFAFLNLRFPGPVFQILSPLLQLFSKWPISILTLEISALIEISNFLNISIISVFVGIRAIFLCSSVMVEFGSPSGSNSSLDPSLWSALSFASFFFFSFAPVCFLSSPGLFELASLRYFWIVLVFRLSLGVLGSVAFCDWPLMVSFIDFHPSLLIENYLRTQHSLTSPPPRNPSLPLALCSKGKKKKEKQFKLRLSKATIYLHRVC